MVGYEKKVSVIIPVYNAEKYLKGCLDSITGQTIPKDKLEVILINDGSTDSSREICLEYAERYPYFRFFNVENGGQAKARNIGVEAARGKYLAYLDSDDMLSKDVLKKVMDFFDRNYDDIDLVTYKIVPVEKGVRKKTHYRYRFMNKTGVYDLTQDENIYITQTNMNIVVKNKGDENVLFDITPNYKHEDQQYCTDVLREKMKIGFVSGCEYLYERNFQSTVFGFTAATVFDVTITKWEEMFASFGDALPRYIQALFVNDIQWKMRADILLPYHLEGEDYSRGVARIAALLNRVEDSVILNHPDCGESNKYYFLSMKHGGGITARITDRLQLVCGENIIFDASGPKLTIDKFKPRGGVLEVCGHLSSPVFSYCGKPALNIRSGGGLREIELYSSSFCYDDAKVKNNRSWGFRFTVDTTADVSFSFIVGIDGKSFGVDIQCGEWTAFNPAAGRRRFVWGTKECRLTDSRIIVKNVSAGEERKYRFKELLKYFPGNIKVFLVRLLNFILSFGHVWLYHDSGASGVDNAYYQFLHDFEAGDGVKRYYVVNGSIEKVRDKFTPEQQKYLIAFRSAKHKLMYLAAEKVITAFAEKVNYLPFFDDVYKYYTDLFKGEVIYLQHGVLHAHLPWKYSYDRLDVSAEVVSTGFEVKNFTENYCFPESALIKSKMPRYDFFDADSQPDGNRVLFAPSWRKYLIKMNGEGKWIADREKFTASSYFKKTVEFLNSPELFGLLEENDWHLDFKLHPIFAAYADCFDITNSRVTVAGDIKPQDYKVFITDYSSFVFDFVYLERAVVYFMPDYKQFKAGMNDYKELDLPFEEGFGVFAQNAHEAVAALEDIIKNDGKPIPPFSERTKDFFLGKDKNCREKIYEAILL